MRFDRRVYKRLFSAFALLVFLAFSLSAQAATPQVAAGGSHSVAVKSDGTVWTWGENNYGQLGDGTTTDSSSPVQVKYQDDTDLTDVVAVAAGEDFSVALKSDHTVWTWGFNNKGQLGDSTAINSNSPVQVVDPLDPSGFLTNVEDVKVGQSHSIALKSDGTVWVWGDNGDDQLGVGPVSHTTVAVQVTDLTNFVTAVAAGKTHSIALDSDHKVWAWGNNKQGQLGDGTKDSHTSPNLILEDLDGGEFGNVVMVDARNNHCVALKSDNTVWAWGNNNFGQLGVDSTVNQLKPVQVVDPLDPTGFLTNVDAVKAGYTHTVALKSDNTVWAWGNNTQGQLGDGTIIDGTPIISTSPVQVSGLTNAIDITAGDSYSAALKIDGTIVAWGLNDYGQFGDNTTTSSNTAVASDAILDPDSDSDGRMDILDNCPLVSNIAQADLDIDGIGDACDACPSDFDNDIDSDGVCGDVDNCSSVANSAQTDTDIDGIGDVCDACPSDFDNDIDNDGTCGDVDNCPALANLSQTDSDGDGSGDLCDVCPADFDNDIDGDGTCGDVDNCPYVANSDQTDLNANGIGDLCDFYAVDTSVNGGGNISPETASVLLNGAEIFTITPASGYEISSVSGCGGTLSGNLFTIAPMAADCSVTANFALSNTPVRLVDGQGTTPYTSVQTAYESISVDDSTIYIKAGDHGIFNLDFNRDVSVKLLGGYDDNFEYVEDFTIIENKVNVSSGEVTLSKVKIITLPN